ncbi:MAG: hypothetical protein IPF77_12360 [Gemmatimonadetes bacterium]|nr:hypothetical protein [Gemmatimonadota bacterium]
MQFTGDAMPGQPVSAPYVPAGAPPEAMAAAIALVASEAMWYGVDRALARWHPPPPLAAPESLLARRTFVELATSDFPSGALCLGGSLAACHRASGWCHSPRTSWRATPRAIAGPSCAVWPRAPSASAPD